METDRAFALSLVKTSALYLPLDFRSTDMHFIVALWWVCFYHLNFSTLHLLR